MLVLLNHCKLVINKEWGRNDVVFAVNISNVDVSDLLGEDWFLCLHHYLARRMQNLV